MPDIALLNDAALLEARDFHLARLEALFAGERLDRPFRLSGDAWAGDLDPGADHMAWLAGRVELLAGQADSALDREVFRPLTLEAWFCGVHFVDAIFGARVYRDEERRDNGTASWWAEYLPTAIGELQPPDLDNHPLWAQTRALTAAMVAVDAPAASVGSQFLRDCFKSHVRANRLSITWLMAR